MARKREIKPGFFSNEDLARLTPHARLLFIGLWTIADRDGRLEDRPLRIHAEVFPYEPKLSIPKLIDELEPEFVKRYSVASSHYIEILEFKKHQRPHPHEVESVIPARECNGAAVTSNGPAGQDLHAFMPSGPSCLQDLQDPTPSQPKVVPAVVVSDFPTNGTVKSWDLRADLVKSLTDAYPGTDIVAEARRAKVWCVTNPTKRKTARGMPKFLNSWMERQQNGAAANGTRPPPSRPETPGEHTQRSAEAYLRQRGIFNEPTGRTSPGRPDLEIRESVPDD